MDLTVPIIAGAAGALVKQLADKGIHWLIQLVGSHSRAVQEQARRNTENFLIRLAKRVEALEAELQPEQRVVFEEALDHPGSSLLIQKALVSAATTENDDRHTLLSELITQRLTAGADDMIALVGAAACDIVNALSSKHIKLLGLLARLLIIRPEETPEIKDQNRYDEQVILWWKPLEEFFRGLDDIYTIDYQHLEGLSCISMRAIPYELQNVLSLGVKPKKMLVTMRQFEALPWWSSLLKVWESGAKYAMLTSIGLLIGTLYHDSHLKIITGIEWR